jgi:hypothetical protein
MIGQHQTQYLQALRAVSPQTREAYCVLIGRTSFPQ